MDIKLNGKGQKIGLVFVIFVGLMAAIYFLYLQPELKKLDPILKQDEGVKANLKDHPLKLYNNPDVQTQIGVVQKQVTDLQKQKESNKPVVTQLTEKDIIVLLGNLTKQLGIDVSNYKVMQDNADNIELNTTFIGQYQDLSLLFQALDHTSFTYGVNALEVKQVAPNASSNQSSDLTYKWAQGKSTEVTNDLPLFLDSILGIVDKKATDTPAPTSTPDVSAQKDASSTGNTSSTVLNGIGTTPTPASPTPSSTPTQPPTGGNSVSTPTKDGKNSSSGTLNVASQDLRVQIKVDLSVSKYAVGLNLNTSVPSGRTNPWEYFVPDSLKNYLGKSIGDFGNSGIPSDSISQSDMNRLLSSPDYVRSEIDRTRSVIVNREKYALNTTQQMTYLYLLLFLDFKERAN